jgi:hypothetical protein
VLHPFPTLQISDPETQALYRAALPVLRERGPAAVPAFQEVVAGHDTFRNEVSRVLHESRTWEEAHRGMQALLTASPPAGAPWPSAAYREQLAAGHMLHVAALRSSRSAEAKDALAHYAGLLVRHESPEVSLVVDALRLVDGHLDPAAHADLAGRTLAYARARLAEQAGCPGCGTAQLRRRAPHLFAGEAATPEARLAQAVTVLEQMAAAAP